MKKYTAEEASTLPILRQGRTTSVSANLQQLKPGEALFIERGVDWVSKSPPYKTIKRIALKNGWKIISGRSPDGKGWNAKRIE